MRFIYIFLLLAFGSAAFAQSQTVLPEARFVISPDTDFPGGDISALFDTSQAACERACLADRSCVAFTYNVRSNACFPKSSVGAAISFIGANSATKSVTDPRTQTRAVARREALPFLASADVTAAKSLVATLARRYPAGTQNAADLNAAISSALSNGDRVSARRLTGYLVALTDSAASWTQYSELSFDLPKSLSSQARRNARAEALPAALNGVLRAENSAIEANALLHLATALETAGRGRDMIPALRQAAALTNRADIAARLDNAIGKYGFRITGHQVDNDSTAPRICVTFSEPLATQGVDYDIYVRTEQSGLVAQADGSQLCLDGAEHGETYAMTFRSGLPSNGVETLARDTALRVYVRDRAPSVRFPGRAYVLPRLDGAALPIETVNLGTVDLRLRAVSDRNLLRALQDNYFGRPLSAYQDDLFARNIGAEIWTGTAEVTNTLNQDVTTRLPLDEMLSGRAPGIYALSATVPGVDRYDSVGATQWFVHSDLGLTSFEGGSGLHIAVRGLSDAKERPGTKVSLISKSNAVLGTSVTDEKGFATFEAGLVDGADSGKPALIVAETQDDLAFLPLTGPSFDLSDRGVEGRAPAGPVDVFLATDRGAYRAGETIGVTALMRDQRSLALPGLPLIAVLSRPDGAEYVRTIAAQSDAGGHVFQLPLGQDVPRGTWRLDVQLGDAAPLASTVFLVEDFLPERLDLALSLPNTDLRPGNQTILSMQSDYLFGAPAADLPVEADIRLQATRTLQDWPGFVFGRYDTPTQPRVLVAPSGRTDATGAASVVMTVPKLDATGLPMLATITARVSEGSGRPVERRLSQPVNSQTALIGIKPEFDDFVPRGSDAEFQIVTLAPSAQAQPTGLEWTLNRVETRYQWYQLYGNWNWEPTTRRTRIATGQLQSTSEPMGLTVPVTDWGEYELVLQSRDGLPAAASTTFQVGWYGTSDARQTPDRLQVVLDKDTYEVGDTARFQVTAPAGGTALVSVLTSDVVSRSVVALDPGDTTIPIPVTDAWGTGAYVTASVLRPVGGDDPTPVRSLGLAHAKIAPGSKRLSVDIAANAITSGQQGFVDVTVKVTGGTGPQFVTLAAVDLGIHNLTSHPVPDPEQHYFGQRRLGVSLRDMYGRLINGQSGSLGVVRSGGDAGARLTLQSPPPTEAPMVFFSGLVAVDDTGVARISVPKPAFNGTIRLDAVAWNAGGVGSASQDIIARDPIVLTASLPRFMAPKDRSRLLLEFVHVDGAEGAMPLRIAANGVELGPVPETVTLNAARKTVVEVPVLARDIGDHDLTVSLTMPNGRKLTKTLSLGIRQNDPETSRTQRFSLAPGDSFVLDSSVFSRLTPGQGRATLTAGPLARLDIPGLVAQLDRYPYGCTEQVTSRALPLLYLGAFAPNTDVQLRVDEAISRVLTRQTSAGSFGLWRAQSGEFWLDAYVSDFLVRARDAGYTVPDLALRLALGNLTNRVNYAPDFDKGGSDIAYALLVLAREGKASIADLRYYADAKSQAFDSPRAVAQLATALASYGDVARADRLFGVAVRLLEKQQELRGWRADFGTSTSDAAAVLRLGQEAGTQALSTQKLLDALSRDRQLNTQEAAQVLMAAHALQTNTTVPSGIALDGQPVSGPVQAHLENTGTSNPVQLRNTGADPTWVTLTTFGVPEIPDPAGGTGYAISRAYYTVDGTPIEGEAETGTQLVVVLTVTPFEDQKARLMIDDPLPAGLEIDNPNLIQSGQIRPMDWLKPTTPENAEFLTDRFRAAVTVRGLDPIQIAYKVRAVSPGDFHHPAALVQDMYRPNQRAITGTGRWLTLP